MATGEKNIIEATKASTIASGNNIYINQGNAFKQIDYDVLADAILNKLSSKTYSDLDTTSKTILGALDELNSNIIKSTQYTSLDDIPTPSWGTYWLSEDIRPDESASVYMGFCFAHITSGMKVLFLVRPYSRNIFINGYTSGAWTGWVKLTGASVS